MKEMQRHIVLLLLVMAMSTTGMAQQTRIVTLTRQLDANKLLGYYASSDFAEAALGIKARLSNGKKIEVRMYAEHFFETGGRADIGSMIYGIYSDNGDGTAYERQYWHISYGSNKCSLPVVNDVVCKKYGTAPVSFNSGRNTYKSRTMAVAKKLNLGVTHVEFPVKVEVEFSGGATEADIVDISLPGLSLIDGLDLLPGDVVPDICVTDPSTKGCALRAAFVNVLDDANKKPIVIAHRGFHGDRTTPENSLAAVKKAYDNGYQYIEVDIRMTMDNVPFLFHDHYLGYASTFPTLNNANKSTETEKSLWNDIKSYTYRLRYWNQSTTTVATGGPDKDHHYAQTLVYLGKESNEPLTSFEELCTYLADTDIFVFLDIKSSPTKRNFEVMRKCMSIAYEHGVLNRIGFKMVRTNAGAPPENQLDMTLQAAKANLGAYYTKFQHLANYNIVDYQPEKPEFVKTWLNPATATHRVVGFEFDFQTRPLQQAPSLIKNAAFESKSAWDYTKSKGYRTGVWSSSATDPRGRPGHDPSQWSGGKALLFFWGQDALGSYEDNRARLEIMSMITPQYITHDRPDEVVRYLSAVGKLNSNSKIQR